MKSVRLTKDMRQRILNSYLACYDASNPEPERYNEKSFEGIFAETLRKRLFDKAGVDETTIPTEFLKRASDIKVQTPDGTLTWFRFYNSEGTDYHYKPCPKLDGAIAVDANDPAYLAYKKAKRELKDLNAPHDAWYTARNEVEAKVRMALDSVNTTGQLLSVWPEAEKFIPTDVLDFSTIQLPSVSFSSLNKAVGI